jgi:hypothetical protein
VINWLSQPLTKNMWFVAETHYSVHSNNFLNMCPILLMMCSSFLQDIIVIFVPLPPHVHIDFVVHPPGCGRSVTDFWGWDAHRARLRCRNDVNDDMCERGVPGGALNLSSTSYPDHGRRRDLPLQGKIPTSEPRIEPGTSWLVVRSSDHQAARLVGYIILVDTVDVLGSDHLAAK